MNNQKFGTSATETFSFVMSYGTTSEPTVGDYTGQGRTIPFRVSVPQFKGKNDVTIVPLFVENSMAEKITAAKETFFTSIDIDDEKLNRSRKFFEEHRAEIARRYLGRYIAIIGDSVVDNDYDFSNLAERVYSKYGYGSVYIPFVENSEQIVLMPAI